ncbi:Plasmodium exported protein, unknown function [Plasmodium malariae]|uniref:Variable surface protein n=1 Tax=Plasmodium malariae TaxID=5858 RepID=A0A1D3JK71_PLAMA|nr:Plasmodium exported protein, unknown function [Plasmodium malariae]SBT86834.1 Plasmodium exported protein, unknown function [Plasmodium malariae]
MEKFIKLLLLIEIGTFFLLSWKYYFYNDVCKFKKSVIDCCKLGKKLDTRPYRLLEQCRKENISNDVWLKEKMLYNVGCAKKDISNSKKLTKDKNKRTEGNLLDNSRYNVKPGKIKKFAYVIGDSHFEEGMSKKKEYENEFRKVAKDDLMILRKRVNKAYIFLYLLPTVLLIAGIIYITLEKLNVIREKFSTIWSNILTVEIVFPLALSLIVLPVFTYVLKKIVKYNKFIYIKSRLRCMYYPSFPKIFY